MVSMKGRTVLITGASRGIGAAMAVRFAKDGANLVLASKTVEPNPRLPGTLGEVAAEVEKAGGQAFVVALDVRYEESVDTVVAAAVDRFGGIDVLINNAGAISLTDLASTTMKKFDLMHQVNVRATYMMASKCLPHLLKGKTPHILSMSPPVDVKRADWLSGHTAYTISKYGMSLVTIGLAEELKAHGIAVNALWPETIIATAAIDMLMGDEGRKNARTPEIMADAAYEILTTENCTLTGQTLIDERFLKTRGVTNFDKYLCVPGSTPMKDLYVE
jgi:citronellol/citronellal dehydrogenase